MTTYFCDGITEVTILNGIARLQFHRLQTQPGTGPNPEVRAVPELMVALPAQGFLQAVALLDRVRDQMTKEGLVADKANSSPKPLFSPGSVVANWSP